ncbi:MAG: uncharacterized protein KVP18_002184 [Porospora cf. gigantea A]|uniref:uncharacterized protein n=1 Tax=Porospora cf. gigantea A TaxID=2853593 RepID=UPI00355971D8|nr:MAG: hypothetical protein KVP18_002184 [Porospora cf. gigantea A]
MKLALWCSTWVWVVQAARRKAPPPTYLDEQLEPEFRSGTQPPTGQDLQAIVDALPEEFRSLPADEQALAEVSQDLANARKIARFLNTMQTGDYRRNPVDKRDEKEPSESDNLLKVVRNIASGVSSVKEMLQVALNGDEDDQWSDYELVDPDPDIPEEVESPTPENAVDLDLLLEEMFDDDEDDLYDDIDVERRGLRVAAGTRKAQ